MAFLPSLSSDEAQLVALQKHTKGRTEQGLPNSDGCASTQEAEGFSLSPGWTGTSVWKPCGGGLIGLGVI